MKTVEHILKKKGRDVWSLHPNDTVFYALQQMEEKDIGALVVMEDDSLVGIVNERDYARNIILKGKSSPKTPVKEIMVTQVVCAKPEQTVEQCMAIMTENRVRHLPILQDGHLVGLISIGDVVKSIIEDQKFTIEELEHYIHTA